jgi:putative sugar O-methyltransferase
MSQLINNTNIKYDDKIVICDIGGGYGGLIRLLKHYFINSTCILIELPETCLLASYFLKNNFPDSKVLLYSDFEDLGGDVNLKQYDFIILPQNMIKKLKNKSIDLTINTSSLSEMKNETQDFYFTEIERITNKYFYSVNRHKFKEQKYNAQGFYNLKFQKRWDTIIYNFTHTYQLEFLGRINEK